MVFKKRRKMFAGGTGFLGKLLIEKLLRSCPELTCIYVIVRPKKGQEALNRFEQIFEDPVSALHCLFLTQRIEV